MTSKPTARERFERDNPDHLEEQGYCAKEKGSCSQCGYDGKFLRKLVEAAIVFGATIGLRGMSPNAPMTEKQALEGLGTEIWEKINQRLAQAEGK